MNIKSVYQEHVKILILLLILNIIYAKSVFLKKLEKNKSEFILN